MTATDLTLTHRLVRRYLWAHHPSVTIDPCPSCALHPGRSIPLALRSQCRCHVEIGHDEEGWWVRVEPGARPMGVEWARWEAAVAIRQPLVINHFLGRGDAEEEAAIRAAEDEINATEEEMWGFRADALQRTFKEEGKR